MLAQSGIRAQCCTAALFFRGCSGGIGSGWVGSGWGLVLPDGRHEMTYEFISYGFICLLPPARAPSLVQLPNGSSRGGVGAQRCSSRHRKKIALQGRSPEGGKGSWVAHPERLLSHICRRASSAHDSRTDLPGPFYSLSPDILGHPTRPETGHVLQTLNK